VVWSTACPCQLGSNFDHTTPHCPQFCSSTQQPFAHLIVGNVSTTTWFPDTDVNQHITPDLAPYLHNDICMLVTVRALTYPILDKLRYIPQNTFLHYPMFFMCLILPNRCYLFRNSAVIIMFILNFTLLCFMSRISSPRKFSFLIRVMMVFMSSPSLLPCQFLKLSGTLASLTADLWLHRLGYPTPRILNLLVYDNKIICNCRHSLTQCQACPLGKSLRMLLQPTVHKTTTPLDLIFSDVWGLTPIFSFDSFCYFVIFIDAHTKHIWYYPLVAKSDVFFIFHRFQTLIEHQFSLKIKYLHTDWGGEYRKLNKFFQTIGIYHRLICPHTHEQNGIVKRRHRHIIETGLTLLGQCSAPLRFWNYAFESSVYLINCMPTLVLQNKSSFECLFCHTLDYNFLRTFGCLCFPFFLSIPCSQIGFLFFSMCVLRI